MTRSSPAPSPFDPALLEAFAHEVRAEWSRRPRAEVKAFQNSLATRSYEPAGPGETENPAPALQIAALSGGFEPDALARRLAFSGEAGATALDSLASHCDRRVVDGRWIWTLKTGPRRETLRRLAEAKQIPRALAEAMPLGTDAPGWRLRGLLSAGGPFAADVGTDECSELQVLVQALAWAEPAADVSAALTEARRRLALAALRDEHRSLVARGVFGRDGHLRALNAFAEKSFPRSRGVPVLSVVGVGGAGKSTLLSEFLLPAYEAMLAGVASLVVITLDFDRVLSRSGAETELSFEVARQLGWARPNVAPGLAQAREKARRIRGLSGLEALRPGFNISERLSSSEFESDAARHIRKHGLDRVPVLLAIDTFEEWQRGPLDVGGEDKHAAIDDGQDPAWRALEWVARLRDRMGLADLRVLLSGRVPASRAPPGIDLLTPRVLKDLSKASTSQLLRRHGLAAGTAAKLSRLVGRNPLALILAARYVRNLDVVGRRAFLAAPDKELAGLDAQLRQGILYDRFLRHIPDPEVARLAHPGLALRRVTPELLLRVLADPCAIAVANREEAAALLRRLAREVWLVAPGRDPEVLHHRPDVRRIMLSMMGADPELAGKIDTIHAAAVSWYRGGNDRYLSDGEAAAEALYHELMLPSGASDAAAMAESAARDRRPRPDLGGLSGAAGDFPAETAASLLFTLGERVPDGLAKHLPPAAWAVWLEDRGAALLSAGYGDRALKLARARGGAGQSAPSWLPRAYVQLGRWKSFGRDMSAYYPSDGRLPDPPRPASSDRERTWRSDKFRYIAAVLADDARLADDVLANLSYAPNAPTGEIIDPLPHVVDRAFVAALRVSGFAAEGSTWTSRGLRKMLRETAWGLERMLSGRDLSATDQLRGAVILLRFHNDADPVAVPASVAATLFRPDAAWLHHVADALGVRELADFPQTQFDEFVRDVSVMSLAGHGADGPRFSSDGTQGRHVPEGSLADRTRTSAILITWSTAFAKLLGPTLLLDAERLASHRAIGLLRGENPEFGIALRSILLRCDDRTLDEALSPALADAVGWCPSDLEPRSMAEGLHRRREETVAKAIGYADRCGALGRLIVGLDGVLRSHPDGIDCRRAFARWDDANWRLVNGISSSA